MKKQGISPNPKVYGPAALNREIVTDRQVRWDEDTIIWGDQDDLPLRIMDGVNRSQTTLSCLGTVETFTSGSGFTDEELMKIPIDADGTTLWDFHCQLSQSITLLESFAVNFKFNPKGRITNAFQVGVETIRFDRPKGRKIEYIKQNPYFGTLEYKKEHTTVYPVYDQGKVKDQINALGFDFMGQMYFWGTVRPPYKFYPIPRYWSGKEWIYVDAGIKEFHKENMENGFFQSTLINVIGNPNQKSNNPDYMKRITQTDGSTKLVPDRTVGEEFDDQMSKKFSGVRKSGTAMVMWSENENKAVRISAFPVNTNFDVLSGTFTDAMRGICTATRVPAILANLPQQASSLGSDGNSIKAAIELMQTNVAKSHQILENFYNTILLPNLETKTQATVKIKHFIPITTQVVVEDKFWDVLSQEEKKEFVRKNVQGMADVIKEVAPIVDENGEPLTPEEEILSDNLKDLNMKQIYRLNKISQQYAKGEINEMQAVVLIKGFGFSDQEAKAWLGLPMEAAKI